MCGRKPSCKTWSTPVADENRRPVPCNLCGGRDFRPAFSCEGFAFVRCARCGLVQQNPQPLPEAIRRRYGDSCGEAYLAYERANEAAFLNLQTLSLADAGFWDFEAALRAKNGGAGKPRVLDIGCATGALLALLRERGWDTAGVEISAPQADYARAARGLEVRSLPLEEARFPAASFDAVLASHLIEHLNDPASLVREARRVLAPGGLFLVTTPNIAGIQARLSGSRWRSAIFDHLYLFSVRTLTSLLESAGFVPERVITWGGLPAGSAPAPLKCLADKAAKRLGAGDVMIVRSRAAGSGKGGKGNCTCRK
ncbi:MAG: class I SAM-dependent methyltransferase [Treponematales bacterium]